MPTWPFWVANGLPEVSTFTDDCWHGGTVVMIVPGGPALEVTVGSSPKMARDGFGGGNTSLGGFGCGATVMLLPSTFDGVSGVTWFERLALTLMFSLLNTMSSGQPMWISVIW